MATYPISDSWKRIINGFGRLGKGAVIRQGLRKIAAYRDNHGQLYQYSAIFRHLQCLVAWNPTEHTWDCPCHGSWHDRFGKVIHGPASQDLLPLT